MIAYLIDTKGVRVNSYSRTKEDLRDLITGKKSLKSFDGRLSEEMMESFEADIEIFQRILDTTEREMEPENGEMMLFTTFVSFLKAHILLLSGKTDEALEIYRSSMKKSQKFPDIYLLGIYSDFSLMERHKINLKGLEDFQKELETKLNAPLSKGFRVKAVTPGSQGEKLGIKINDRLLEYNGRKIVKVEQFANERKTEKIENDIHDVSLIIESQGKTTRHQAQSGLLGLLLE